MKKIVRGINCLIINNIKMFFIKLFHMKSFKYHYLNLISPFCSIDIQNQGKINLGKKCNILKGTVLGVREEGKLSIGDGTFINQNCQVICHKQITIGNDVCIGPNTVIVDHDHKFGKNGVEKKNFNCKDIVIGNNVWIGANCVILKDTKIGDNAVIGAGSIVFENVGDNTTLIQKKINNYR